MKGNMSSKNYELLNDMLQDFKKEHAEICDLIENNLLSIKHIDSYLSSLFSKEEDDYKVFSPRNVESLYKDEIEKSNLEKEKCQTENNRLYHERNILASRIATLEKILSDAIKFNIDSDTRDRNLTVLNIQEEDRQRIARDLHDTSLQNLAHLVHKIELSSMYIDKDPNRAKLELAIVNKNLKSTIDEIRTTIFDLRPMTFDDLGLHAAFERLISVINENKIFEIDMDIDDVSCENDLVMATIYRVVKECFLNIVKHSNARKVIFRCKLRNDIYYIDIEDDGRGFSKEDLEQKKDKHFGLLLMRERTNLLGGKIIINSEIDKGTKFHIEIPLLKHLLDDNKDKINL